MSFLAISGAAAFIWFAAFWKTENAVEFNTLLDPLPMLLVQPVIQYYANVGGRAQRSVVFGFRTKVEF